MKAFVLIFLFALPLHAQTLDIALAGATAFDVETTLAATSHGMTEQNPIARPFMSNRAAAYGFAAGTTAAAILGAKWLRESGHPKWANVLKLAAIGSHVTFGIRNVRLMK